MSKKYRPRYSKDHEYSTNPLVKAEEKAQQNIAESDVWLLARWSTDISMPDCEDTKTALESLGFTIVRQRDFLFYEVVPPHGWTKTTEGYWTEIYDEQGNNRGLQFHKGATYDRRAHLDLES